jgi:ATP adenylyltransferase/5',5'''-P-1,P-4-tetraphosphate phosphorylase II
MRTTHLYFNSLIGSQKPENITNQDTACPFCDPSALVDILDRDGDIILLKNKYPVLEDAMQTVLIETANCNSELSVYPKQHLYRVLRFGIRHWLEMEKDPAFASVIFYKNHGPFSGGTIRHPHMQIVGLDKIDYRQQIKPEYFVGECIDIKHGVALNLSTLPRIGFFEFNIVGKTLDQLEQTADYIQTIAHYILNHFHRRCKSYNLFFYRVNDSVAIKLTPRFVTSPLFVGYAIPQLPNRLLDVVAEVRSIYF